METGCQLHEAWRLEHSLSSSWSKFIMATMGPGKVLEPMNRQSIGFQQKFARGLISFG